MLALLHHFLLVIFILCFKKPLQLDQSRATLDRRASDLIVFVEMFLALFLCRFLKEIGAVMKSRPHA